MSYAFNDDKSKYDLNENVLGGASNTLYDAELAIAENAADIADLQDSVLISLDPIRVTGSTNYTVGANNNADVIVNFDIPEGYMMVNASIGSFGDPSIIMRAFDYHIGGSYVRVYLRNLHSAAITNRLVMNALCVKVGV